MGVAVPAGVERQDVPLEHPLEQTDQGVAVAHDHVVLGRVASEGGEAEVLIELPRHGEVLDCQAHRERTEVHACLPQVGS